MNERDHIFVVPLFLLGVRMPKNMSLYNALKKQYGSRADEIYARMEAEGKAPFQKGLKTAKAHGHLKGGK